MNWFRRSENRQLTAAGRDLHAGPRRGTLNADEDQIVAEAEKGIAEIEDFLARQPVKALALA